jgi:hypothetical protein
MRTGDELREMFNLKYNNINSGSSPGLNDYEISLYLTEAQREIIENFYAGSMKGFTFEQMEKVRKNLSVVTKESSVNLSETKPGKKQGFKVYEITFGEKNPKPWRVVSEFGVISERDRCLEDEEINIKPIRHNEINRILMNPFRGPTRYNILRTDISDKHELYSAYPLKEYIYRYISYPEPIIIRNLWYVMYEEDLMSEIAVEELEPLLVKSPKEESIVNYPLTIENKWEYSESIFDVYMEDMIVDRAVELATVGYKENSLQAQLMTNIRKE